MKNEKLQRLFSAARQEGAPAVSPNFAQRVMREMRPVGSPAPVTLLDSVAELFPQLAFGALLAIAASVALDLAATNSTRASLQENVAQISAEWMVP